MENYLQLWYVHRTLEKLEVDSRNSKRYSLIRFIPTGFSVGMFWYMCAILTCRYIVQSLCFSNIITAIANTIIDFSVATRYNYFIYELENWLPVCKSKYLFMEIIARANSSILKNRRLSGIYDSKPELKKPNRLNQLLRHDKIIPDQTQCWKKGAL